MTCHFIFSYFVMLRYVVLILFVSMRIWLCPVG